jgi:hypothetical protein
MLEWPLKASNGQEPTCPPVPYVRNVVESIGRWGDREESFEALVAIAQVKVRSLPFRGKQYPIIPNTHINGLLTRKEDAIKQTEYISRTHGNLQVDRRPPLSWISLDAGFQN